MTTLAADLWTAIRFIACVVMVLFGGAICFWAAAVMLMVVIAEPVEALGGVFCIAWLAFPAAFMVQTGLHGMLRIGTDEYGAAGGPRPPAAWRR